MSVVNEFNEAVGFVGFEDLYQPSDAHEMMNSQNVSFYDQIHFSIQKHNIFGSANAMLTRVFITCQTLTVFELPVYLRGWSPRSRKKSRQIFMSMQKFGFIVFRILSANAR
ncbi:hypothetical protein TSUD_44160 [Trifolium subterraneum]|uniref:Uncharacterized protein n=1 Tax=Trifolium subterraneum TaxID=3900 RepID=A0A2Z6MRQ5_TRISU|nr:hypothetical protein TSUD_44160 [Trifolium subterraneum]